MCRLQENSQSLQTLIKQTGIKSAEAQWACLASAEILTLIAHMCMPPNQQRTGTDADGEGEGVKINTSS